jgi:hypothetical protein
MADGHRLTGGSGSCHRGRSFYVTGSDATDESTADFLASVQLSAGERASPSDGRARAVITWSFGLKQAQHPLRAVGGPCGDKTSVGFAQRLWRSHQPGSVKNAMKLM